MVIRRLKIAAALGLIGLGGLGGLTLLGRSGAAPPGPPAGVPVTAPVPARTTTGWKAVAEVNHEAAVTAAAAAGNLLVTMDSDRKYDAGGVRFWDARTGAAAGKPVPEAEAEVPGRPSPERRLAVDAAGGRVAFDDGNGIAFAVAAAPGGGAGPGPFGPCKAAAVRNLDRLAVSADTAFWVIRLRDAPHQFALETRTPTGFTAPWGAADPDRRPVTHAALSADAGRVATANADAVLRVYDRDKKSLREVSRGTAGQPPTALRLSGDGKRLAVVGPKGFARVYDADSGKDVCELAGHDGPVAAVAFTPDGRQVATAVGKTVRVYDAASGKKLSEFEAHADDVTCLGFTPDGKRLVTGSKDKTARVWERE